MGPKIVVDMSLYLFYTFYVCAFYYRNNPNNVCRLEIVNSYFTVQNGKKVYNRGKAVN